MTNLTESLSKELKSSIATKTARESFKDFCVVVDQKYDPQWFHKTIADVLQNTYQRVLAGESPRIMIFMPPRHGKSEESTKKFPAWVLGKNPDFPIIISTYSQDLSTKFGQGTRDIMISQNYKAVFPNTKLREDTQAKASWMTDLGGGYEAVGVGGAITGKGFKIGIIDDPIKNDEEAESEIIRDKIYSWYGTTFYTRQEGNAAIILIQTRWHDDDLAGRLLNDQKTAESEGLVDYDHWEVINFPAIAEQADAHRLEGDALWPGKFSIEQLNKTKKTLGPYKFSALYQQNPVDSESQEFKKGWYKYRDLDEVARLSTRKFLTIDPASAMRGKSDNIGATLNFVDRENKWNFITWKLRMSSPELISFMFAIYSDYGFESVGIEEGVYQQVIKPYLDIEMRSRNIFFPVVELKHNQVQKVLRIRGLIPYYNSGSIYHITGMCDDLEEEQLRFPKGVHDDVLDSAAYQIQLAKPPELYVNNLQSSPIKPFYPELGM